MQTAPFSSYKEDEGIRRLELLPSLSTLDLYKKKVSLDKIQVFLIRKLRLYCWEQMQLKEKWHIKRAEDPVHKHNSS